MDQYYNIQVIGYMISGVSFILACFFFFFAKIPDKIHLLQEGAKPDFCVVKSVVLVNTSERVNTPLGAEEEAYEEEKDREQTINFKLDTGRIFHTTKHSG